MNTEQPHAAIAELEAILDSKDGHTIEINPLVFLEFIRNPAVIWYGPHVCNKCGAKIVKSSFESGGIELDAEDPNRHYPNFGWVRHTCNPSESTVNKI